MELRYAGTCKVCGNRAAVGERAYWDASARTVTCRMSACCEADGLTRQEWQGSPVYGAYVTVRAERRIGEGVAANPFAKTRSRGYYGRDARRCEDAPCCGCCD